MVLRPLGQTDSVSDRDSNRLESGNEELKPKKQLKSIN